MIPSTAGNRAAQSTALAIAGALLAAATSVCLLRALERRRRPCERENDAERRDTGERRFDFDTSESEEGMADLAREIEEEWEQSAKTSLKRSMYDNVLMLSRDRAPMCTISAKKARWYVSKDLGEWTTLEEGDVGHGEYDPGVKCIRFLYAEGATGERFGANMTDHLYLRSAKQNVCVGCGDDEHHMRHYIVPYSYRALLPSEYKTHMSHDIVILCPDCHLRCEGRTKARMRALEREFRARRGEEGGAFDVPPVIDDPAKHRVRNCAIALARRGRDDAVEMSVEEAREAEGVVREHLASACKDEVRRELLLSGEVELTMAELQKSIVDDPEKSHVRKCAIALARRAKDTVPEEEVQEAETVVREYLASQCTTDEKKELMLSGAEQLTKSQIQKACSVKCHVKNPAYLTPSEVVVRSLENERDVEAFIKGWRRHFLEAVEPRFMPSGWTVDNPVISGKEARRMGMEGAKAW